MHSYEKACRGECGRILPATEEHFYRDRRGLRSTCRDCYRETARVSDRATRRPGAKRTCDYCHVRKELADFDTFLYKGAERHRETCRGCVAKMTHPDPMAEAEADFSSGFRAGQRWAVALAILLGRRGMTLADYKRLAGAEHRAFEARWSELLKEMARDMGEWLPEWDDVTRVPSSRPAPRPEGLRRVA